MPPAEPAGPRPARIAWFGHDWGIACARELVARGHRIEEVFTDDLDASWVRETRALARALGVPLSGRRPTTSDLERLAETDVDLIISAGYPWRIPVITGQGPRGINVHPSLLPQGRGPNPFSHVILRGDAHTGVTVHELAERFDDGAVVHQAALAVHPNETYETLTVRCQMLASGLLVEVLDDLDGFWARRHPQGEGSWWPNPTREQRTLPLSGAIADIDRVARAFEPGATLACVGGRFLAVENVVVWSDRHGHVPGTVVQNGDRSRLIATADGYALVRLSPRRSRARAVATRALRIARGVIPAGGPR